MLVPNTATGLHLLTIQVEGLALTNGQRYTVVVVATNRGGPPQEVTSVGSPGARTSLATS
jgi:hypothetical protein